MQTEQPATAGTVVHPVIGALMSEAIDYAGLFPPATLSMEHAVRNYTSYRQSTDAWALGRFVVPVAWLDELSRISQRHATAAAGPWHVSALLGADPVSDLETVARFNAAHKGRLLIDALEGKITGHDTIREIAGRSTNRYTVYCELLPDDTLEGYLDTLTTTGMRAKIRTGGVKAEMIPSVESVLRFLRACVERKIPFKATAGLHHPLRSDYPLTYEQDSPRGTMFGFLNVFLAATLLYIDAPTEAAHSVLMEQSIESIHLETGTFRWNGLSLTNEAVRRARSLLVSFGSCSFREPMDELRALGLL